MKIEVEKLVLSRILEIIGYKEITAKSIATKFCNKLQIEKDRDGFVNISDIIKILNEIRLSNSEFAEEANVLRRKWEKSLELTKPLYKKAIKPEKHSAEKASPYIDAKILEMVLENAKNRNDTRLINYIAKKRDAFLVEAETKKLAKQEEKESEPDNTEK